MPWNNSVYIDMDNIDPTIRLQKVLHQNKNGSARKLDKMSEPYDHKN